jgi:hypothetical protein
MFTTEHLRALQSATFPQCVDESPSRKICGVQTVLIIFGSLGVSSVAVGSLPPRSNPNFLSLDRPFLPLGESPLRQHPGQSSTTPPPRREETSTIVPVAEVPSKPAAPSPHSPNFRTLNFSVRPSSPESISPTTRQNVGRPSHSGSNDPKVINPAIKLGVPEKIELGFSLKGAIRRDRRGQGLGVNRFVFAPIAVQRELPLSITIAGKERLRIGLKEVRLPDSLDGRRNRIRGISISVSTTEFRNFLNAIRSGLFRPKP